jgi:hypothetical protein
VLVAEHGAADGRPFVEEGAVVGIAASSRCGAQV